MSDALGPEDPMVAGGRSESDGLPLGHDAYGLDSDAEGDDVMDDDAGPEDGGGSTEPAG